MLDFLEFEETVGRLWHRMVGEAASYPRHRGQAVTLDEVRGSLMVFFRGLGGDAGVQLTGAARKASQHRLQLRQRVGTAEERLEAPRRDESTLFLPSRIELFPVARLNRALYFWMGAYCAHVPLANLDEADPLRRDLLTLQRAHSTVQRTLVANPGLRSLYGELSAAILDARPLRRLPSPEREVEAFVVAMLSGDPLPAEFQQVLAGGHPILSRAPRGYMPFLPVPLWADSMARARQHSGPGPDHPAEAEMLVSAIDGRKRPAARREPDQSQRRDSFILNRFEKILSLSEMVNVNRPSEDDEEDEARKAADDLDELVVSRQHPVRPATRLKFDLDLPPEEIDRSSIDEGLTYPEWDYSCRAYLRDHSRVFTCIAEEMGERWAPDGNAERLIRRVRRQFEALRPRHEVMRAQIDGNELDIDAVVRSMSDMKSGGVGTERVHLAHRPMRHDLGVALLVDVSLSTDSWVDGRRVLDIEKEALLALAHGLDACGDSNAIFTFTSRRRNWVRVETVKDFDEPMDQRIARRISALKPGYYTRMGPAIRHASARLSQRPNRKRLLLVITDGKPNDVDHYEGRYGIEDTRRAVLDARQSGICVFGVTVDSEAQSYFPALFGRGGYAILGNASRLPAALPAIYRELAR